MKVKEHGLLSRSKIHEFQEKKEIKWSSLVFKKHIMCERQGWISIW